MGFGKVLLTLDAVGLLFGAPLADYNHTHIFNPRWPPHAKFHTGQTITLSVILGAATLWYSWRSSLTKSSTPALAAQLKRESLRTAVFTGSIYWLAGLAAIMFPNTSGLDPEFGGPGFPQMPLFTSFAALGIVGYLLESMSSN